MAETFEEFMARERERLNGERAKLIEQRNALDEQIAAIDREGSAITAYERAKAGKSVQAPRGPRTVARRGSKRDDLLRLINNANGTGLSRAEILTAMGLKGDKSGEMSVSNALTALTKSNQVVRDGGKYKAAA